MSTVDHSRPRAPAATTVLDTAAWRAAARAHALRADALTAAHLRRAARGEKHPVEDFLFTYYSHRPARLRAWAPGAGVALATGEREDDDPRTLGLRDHVVVPGPDGPVLTLDVAAFLARRGPGVAHIAALLRAVASRPAQLGCFGLHEWAMVYRLDAAGVRHAAWPLRLGRGGTDAVVESNRLRCSHIDAFRFFTPAAVPRNELAPTRDRQAELDQPGCLHATMDLYKWAYKLDPAVPGDLVLDCFELARDVRRLDMRASPYDLSALGYEPVRIETPEGRATYAAEQRGFAERAAPLRQRLLEVCDRLGA